MLALAIVTMAVSQLALRRAHLHLTQVERRARIAGHLLRSPDLAQAAAAVLTEASSWGRAHDGVVVVRSAHGAERRLLMSSGRSGPSELTAAPLDDADRGMLDCLARGDAVHLGHGATDPRVTRFAAAHHLDDGIVVALRDDSGPVGLMALGNGHLGEAQVAALDDAAHELGRCLVAGHLTTDWQARDVDRSDSAETNLDPVTGLPNRTLLLERLREQLDVASANGRGLAVMAVTVDSPGAGHATATTVVRQLGTRLASLLRAADTGARIGEHSFAVLIADLDDTGLASPIAQRLARRLGASVAVGETLVDPVLHIGVRSVDGGASASATAVLREAESAAQAAGTGADALRLYTTTPPEDAGRGQLAQDLHAAIERGGELSLHYQPIIHLENRAILGAEALLRWTHPTRGAVPPLEFLPLAEAQGLAAPLGQLVLRQACQQLASWHQRFERTPPLAVSVNISQAQFDDPGFAAEAIAIIEDSGVTPDSVILEFSEDLILSDLDRAEAVLDPLQRAGVTLAIDDVGTGHATLEYLRRLPVDILKIGRPFIEALVDEDPATGVAHAVVAQGTRLRMQLIAEGVENPIQVTRLLGLGCIMAQGYHLARPTDVAGIEQMLALRDQAETLTADAPPPAATADPS